jgi:hypothetical protein
LRKLSQICPFHRKIGIKIGKFARVQSTYTDNCNRLYAIKKEILTSDCGRKERNKREEIGGSEGTGLSVRLRTRPTQWKKRKLYAQERKASEIKSWLPWAMFDIRNKIG